MAEHSRKRNHFRGFVHFVGFGKGRRKKINHRMESWRPGAASESERIYLKTKPLLWTESRTDSIPSCRGVKNEEGKEF